ncbi:hypothetical protein [Aeromonas jandaei]|uniref:hypothetical protein n=1 Tax=Aeromonas jandaei TaxID=650 RepID=UPI003BA3B06D
MSIVLVEKCDAYVVLEVKMHNYKKKLTAKKNDDNISLKGSGDSANQDSTDMVDGWRSTLSYKSERHNESEGESESEDHTIVYRALRPDELPYEHGLLPPTGSDPSKTSSQHVQAGTKAKVKSAWVSTTRSIRTAGAWATYEGEGRVAKLKIPSNIPKEYWHDLSTPQGIYDVFNTKLPLDKKTPPGERRPQTGVWFSISSKEVLLKGGVPPSSILAVYKAERVSEREYDTGKATGDPDTKYFKSRSKKIVAGVRQHPYPVRLTEMKKGNPFEKWMSHDFHHDYVGKARRFYKTFNDYERALIKSKIGSPYELDDIDDETGYLSYKAEVLALLKKC